MKAIEVSVLWHTEGKGDEDMAVTEFWRRDAEDGHPIDASAARASPDHAAQQSVELRRPDRQVAVVRARAGIFAPRKGRGGRENVSAWARSAHQAGAVEFSSRRHGGLTALNQMPALSTSDNPFSTRRTSPGAIPYVFRSGENADALVDRLRQAGWWGEIIGPHGSGNRPCWRLSRTPRPGGQRTVLVTLHDGERRLPLRLRDDPSLRPPLVLMVDGYEQLGCFSRLTLKRFCRRHRLGLLVTAHRPVGFPHLYRTAVTAEVAWQIVSTLLDGHQQPFTPDEVSTCLSRHDGNMREALFELYDLFEKRRPLGKI